MASSNQSLAALLAQMSDLMQILGQDAFRVAAFARTARLLEDLPEDVSQIGPDPVKLATLPGIGKGMAQRIAEYLQTGQIQEHAQLLAQVPPGLPALLEVPGLGPKTIALLWQQAHIESLDDLKARLATDELTKLPGFGLKKLENLRKNLAFVQAAGQRMRLGQAMPLANHLVQALRNLPQVKQAAYAGSLRRGRETVGDLDLLVAADPPDAELISAAFIQMEPVEQILGRGATKTSIRTREGWQADLRIVPPDSFGAALMYFTGSKEHNVALRALAAQRGLKLNEYGLFQGEKQLAGKTEEQVFAALGLDYIAPELREDRDEIKLASERRLPKLVQMDDIRAELHAHTTASDGSLSIRELIELAIDRRYHTIAVTDHSASQVIANGLNAARLAEHIEKVRELAQRYAKRIRVLAGSEVDILSDGRLDYPNSLLKELDIVIASPHVALSQNSTKATPRLLKAINNPYVTILGHPTGRLINRREGLALDMKQVISAAAERGIGLEINANSYRLDLRDNHARAALEAGVKLAVNTDFHHPADLDQLIYGLLTARRAGATASQVVNCLSQEELSNWIKSTRR